MLKNHFLEVALASTAIALILLVIVATFVDGKVIAVQVNECEARNGVIIDGGYGERLCIRKSALIEITQ